MIRVGKIVATHGVQGAVIMTHIVGASNWMTKGQALMVEMQKDSYIPYFVADFKPSGEDEYQLTLEDMDQVESAKRLIKKNVFINEDVLAVHAKKSPLLWIGFQVTDVNQGIIGVIDDVMQTAQQWLGKIMHQEKEVLIPLIPQMIKDVNIKTKRIIMELPEGLLEVYTS